ncbi:MAG: QueT transporter family protein [Thaumarchaeota archaeon]|nr:QueT transporter family protein [Nitrososphaerota archaeon]
MSLADRRVRGPPPVPPLETPGRRREENINKTDKETMRSPRRSVLISTAAVYAAMYVALALVFNPISYGAINLRVANVLIGLVPIIGWPAVLGQTLGVFLANQPALGDPLGPIDLINVIPSFFFSFLLWKLRNKSVFVGLTLYSVALGISVSYALNYAFKLPLLVEIPQVTVGVFIATAVFGYLLFRSVKRLGVLQRKFPN